MRDSAEVEAAVEHARQAQISWGLDGPSRAAGLGGWATEIERDGPGLADPLSSETGKPITEARAEVARTVAIIRYYAQRALADVAMEYPGTNGARLHVRRRPRGVILAITPWNFPLAIPTWKLAPALASGNVGLLRPSSAAIATAGRLVELSSSHPPRGVLTVLSTTRRSARSSSPAMASMPSHSPAQNSSVER